MANAHNEDQMIENIRRQKSTIASLKNNGYDCVSLLGFGGFGTVVELEHSVTKSKIAAKIVLGNYVSESEIHVWPRLQHENILKLENMQYVQESDAYIFLTNIQPTSLNVVIEQPPFKHNVNSYRIATLWLKGICEGVKYLHDMKLAHLDLKLNNVLISESATAMICDFGSLTKTEQATNRYVSPFYCRAPEGFITESGHKVVVDAFKYDIYTLGILAIQLFTKLLFNKPTHASKNNGLSRWIKDIYPKIFNRLRMAKFKELVKKRFLCAEIPEETIVDMRNFVCGCITLNPRNRPSINEVLQHKLLGGCNIFLSKANDIWQEKAKHNKVHFLLSLYIGQAASLGFHLNSYAHGSKGVNERIVLVESLENQKSCEPEECVSNENKKSSEPEECVVNEKRSFWNWAARKKANVSRAFHRMFSVFHRSRK